MTVDEKTALENALKQEPQMMARQALLKLLWKLSQCDQMKQKSPQDTTKALKSIKENRFIAGQSNVDFGQDSGRASDLQHSPGPTPSEPDTNSLAI